MDLLLDNDVVYKLAAFDLLSEAMTALNAAECTVFVLNTLPFQARGRKIIQRYGEATLTRLNSFVNSHNLLDREVTNPELIAAMNETRGLDIGEMQLLSALVESSVSNLMLTGDKRFMKTLARCSALSSMVESVRGKFISLEQIILCVIECFSFDDIKEKIASGIEHDTCIRLCFGGVDYAEKDRTKENLLHHINELQKETDNLLIHNETLLSNIENNPESEIEDPDTGGLEPSFL